MAHPLDEAIAGPEVLPLLAMVAAALVAWRRLVRGWRGPGGVLLWPATVAQIDATAHGGDGMPPKTTFLHPKLKTGLVSTAWADAKTFGATLDSAVASGWSVLVDHLNEGDRP